MGLGSTVANLVMQWAAKRSKWDTFTPRLGNPWMAGQAIFPEWSTEKAVKEGYKASYIYYTVASDIADCIRSVPWVVKRKTKTGSDLVDSHPLMEMLRSPNSETTWGALSEAWDLFKSIDGDAYGHFVQIADEMKIWLLRNDRVRIVPDKRGHIESYKYTLGGESEHFPPEEILHFKFFDPSSDYYGLAPLQAGAPIIDTLNASIKWNRVAIGRRAIKDMILAPEKGVNMSGTQYEDWIKHINKQIHGPENAHGLLINSFGVQMAEMSRTPIEMDFIKSAGFYEAAACKILHVHPEAIGALGATFENKEWAIRDKWQGPVESRLSEMRAVFNHKFRPLFGTADPKLAAPGELFMDYDLTNTPGANAAQKEGLDRAVKAWKCGVPWDVADEKFGVGIGPVPGGDVGYLPVNVLPAGTTLPAATARSEDGSIRFLFPEGRSSRSFNLETKEQFAAHWRAVDRRKQGWERGVAPKVAQEFRLEREAVVKAIKAGHVDVDYVIDARAPSWSKLITAVMRAVIEDFGGQVADDLNGRATEVGPRAGLSEDLEARQGYEFDPWNDLIKKWVTTKTAEDVVEIGITTKKAIRKVVLASLKAGESSVKIAKQIEGVYRHWEKVEGLIDPTTKKPVVARAMMIARTEVHTATGFGMHESARQSGVAKKKAWLSAMDPPRAREMHMEISGIWIPFDEPYVMADGATMQHPGDGPADHVIGCRCTEMYKNSS